MSVRLGQEIQTLPRQVTQPPRRNMKIALEPASVRGFRFAGVSAGLKTKAGALDLGLIVADRPCAAAAVFSANHVKAAPVYVTADRVKSRPLAGGGRQLGMRQQLHRQRRNAARPRFVRARRATPRMRAGTRRAVVDRRDRPSLRLREIQKRRRRRRTIAARRRPLRLRARDHDDRHPAEDRLDNIQGGRLDDHAGWRSKRRWDDFAEDGDDARAIRGAAARADEYVLLAARLQASGRPGPPRASPSGANILHS